MKVQRGDGDFEIIASAQPLFSKSDELTDPLGYGVRRRYKLFICEGGKSGEIEQGDWVLWGELRFKVKRIDPMAIGDVVLYYKAIADLVEEANE